MSEELHTYIEPELEARVTALVLGEASEFEIDELERLIKEKPELAVFRRRMQAMNDLLGEAVKPEPNEEWQLSADRRANLRSAFAQKSQSATRKEVSNHSRTQWRAAVSIVACLLVCVVIFSLMTPVLKRSSSLSVDRDIDFVSYMASEKQAEESAEPSVPPTDDSEIFKSKNQSRRAELRKPSVPSSSMAKVTGSNTNSPVNIPVPDETIPMPSQGYGNGEDFGDGWGGRLGGGGRTDDSRLTQLNKDLQKQIESVHGSKAEAKKSGSEFHSRVTGTAVVPGRKGKVVDGGVILDDVAWSPERAEYPVTEGKLVPADDPFSSDDTTTPAIPRAIAEREFARRSSQVTEADKALVKGRDAYAKGDYEEAARSYRLAEELLPLGPASADRKAAYADHLSDANIALARKYRRIGKYQEARGILTDTLKRDPANTEAMKQLEYLEAPIRTSPALTYEHTQQVEDVRRKLYRAEGFYNLGKYDEAEAEMKRTLEIDPYNKAARRWLEKIAATKSDYYRSAYDHTRAKLLAEVDKAWETAVPPEPDGKPKAKPSPTNSPTATPGGGFTGEVAKLHRQLQQSSDAVAEKRKKLMDVAERVGVIWLETEKGGDGAGGQLGLRDLAEHGLVDANKEKEILTAHINKLLTLNDDDLVSVAADLPDVGFQENYNQFVQAKRELQVKKAQGLAEGHPDIVAREKAVAELETSLRKRAVNVRESLKHRLKTLEGRVDKMREVLNEQADRGTDKARDFQEFNKLRKEYQAAQAEKGQLEVRLDIEKQKAGNRVLRTEIPSPVRPKALPDETVTTAAPFSTFSLNVSDVSFKLAKAALLENGQWPEAAKVRTEEFVNAFNYGDPSPPRGEPVACAVEQSAHPFLQQRNLLRIGMKTASLGRSTPLRLTVLLDNSGSMEREDREASVHAAMQVLAQQLGPQDVITLVSFASKPRLLADRITGDKSAQLVNLVASTPSEGGTNLEEALRLARTLALRQRSEGAQDRVVLITDGVANLGNTVPTELSREIETMRQLGIAFDACGVGAEGLNDEILEALTRKGDGRYYFLNRAEDADSAFAKQLAGALTPAAKNVKVQVKFNPKRVSRYRLLGFEKHRLNKEDFRNDKVDAAEMAAEEAGNAVYQIQVNPDGEGELGEVFVRFLDTNTGRMVERSWPLPYEPQAKAFDQAAPSMQLAGTAAMLGEKLHATDAGSVRFQMIAETLGKLRAHYRSDSRVQDLIRMCEKVK
ncbi:hypothetical protein NT6N_29110 [Oceaniferula spumae]|uniref:VWFA domain-containing protein n=1 Tax=Oceaniferula spumae TaxID=2979115 RepID=A0AAT9FPD3_9BACT